MSVNKTLGLLLERHDPGDPEMNFGPSARPYVSGGGTLKKAGGGKRAFAGKEYKAKARNVGHTMKTVKAMERARSFKSSGGGKKG